MDPSDSNPEWGGEKPSFNRRDIVKWAGGTAATAPFVTWAAAQSDDDFVQILGTDPTGYPEVDVSVYVDSQAGRDGELTIDDFKVYEDGAEKSITSLDFSSSALDLVFVFDDSGSMGSEIGAMKNQVNSLVSDIEAAGIDARYGLVSFRDSVDTDLQLTGNVTELQSAVNGLNASGGGDFPEDNFDAIERALDFDYRADAQKVLIDITDATSHYDGDGSGVSEYTLDEVAADLQESGANYIAVSPGYDDPEASKKVLSNNAGGLWIDIYEADFTEILENITQTVIDTYVASYSSSTPPDAEAKVAAEVNDPGKGAGRGTSTVRIPQSAVLADAVITDAELPPTAVETDEPIEFEVTLDSIQPDPTTLNSFPTVGVSWRQQDLGTIEPNLSNLSVNGNSAVYTFEVPSAEELVDSGTVSGDDITPEGLGFEVDITSTPSGSGSSGNLLIRRSRGYTGETSVSVYAFREVDTLGVVPVLPSNVDVHGSHADSPSRSGASLFSAIRTHAEYVNQYYAGGFGSMGAHGFDFRVITQERSPASSSASRVVDGWFKLEQPKSAVSDGGRGQQPDNTMKITDQVGDDVVNVFDVTWGSSGEYDTLMTVGSERYSKAYCRGNVPPDEINNSTVSITIPGLRTPSLGPQSPTIEVPVSYFTRFFLIDPVRTPAGSTDAIYCEIDGPAWRHELGHSLGPGDQIGLPDLYEIDGPDNLGVIHNWGLMGAEEGDTMTAYSRRMGGNLYTFDGWSGARRHFHAFNLSISPDPLSEMRIGENVDILYSGSIDYTLGVPGTDTSVPGPHINLDRYFIEARRNRSIPGNHPDDGTLSATPASNDGIAIYKYSSFEWGPAPEDADGLSEDLVGKLLPTLNYHENPQGNSDIPTLTDQRAQVFESYHDPESGITFEITEGFSGGGPEVEVNRNPLDHLPEWAEDGYIFVADLLEEPVDFLGSSWDALTEGIGDVGGTIEGILDGGGDVARGIAEEGSAIIVEVDEGGGDLVIWGFENGEEVVVDSYESGEELVIEGVEGGEAALESGERVIIRGADTGSETAVEIYESGEEITITGLEAGSEVIEDPGGTGETIIEGGADALPDPVTDAGEAAEDCIDDPFDTSDCLPSGGLDLPGLDILVQTEDGHRAGIDPETGDTLREIDGARVLQQGSRTLVTVPGHPSVDVTISAARRRDAIEDAGATVPDVIDFERTVIVDDGTTVRNLNGLPFLDGRVRHRSSEELAVGDDHVTVETPVLESVSVDLHPDQLNTKSQGKFVTSWIELPEGLAPEDVIVESFLLDGVEAVSDTGYGFVKNPPVREAGGRTELMVKFPRGDLLDVLEEGTHDLTLTGAVGETMVRGSTSVQVRNPGGGRGPPEHGQDD